jgi:hypothetical protein
MALPTLSGKTVDWEKQRDDWIEAVEKLCADVQSWSLARGWVVRREQKTLREDRLGAYVVPVLTIQSPQGRLLLNPIARYVVGANGRVDLDAFPSFEAVPIIRTETGWRVASQNEMNLDREWNEASFAEVSTTLMISQ